MLKHTFRARDDIDGRVVIHPVGSAPDGYVLGEGLEGEDVQGDIVVEGAGSGAYTQQLESLRAYGEYLEESVEVTPDENAAESAEAAVAEAKADVAKAGSEDQVDANILGDQSDAGEPSATEATKANPGRERVTHTKAQRERLAETSGDA